MIMFDAKIHPVYCKIPYSRRIELSFYGKKRGLHGRTETKLDKANIKWVTFSFEYYTNNPVFECHIRVGLLHLFAN